MKAPLRLRSTVCTWLCVVCLLALILVVAVPGALAQNISGHVFTTFSDGTTVNGNVFPSKDAVYLNGGPQNENSKGLTTGLYYFQVTNPNGTVLLSTDDISCRQVVVGIGTGGKGVFQGHPSGAAPTSCTASDSGQGNFHANGSVNVANGGSIPVQLCAQSGCPAGSPDFSDTPNPGGEYKVWVTLQSDYNACASANGPSSNNNFCFVNSADKTDNFKVQQSADVKVCKFNDQNDDGLQDNSEPLLPHWPITATGVTGGTVNAQTDDSGCISFAVSSFTNNDGTQTVTLTEGTQGSGWTQTAPADGSCTLTGSVVNAADTCSVSNGVITLTVSPHDSVSAPNFGNFNPADCGGDCPLVVTKTANPSFTRTFTWGITKSVDNTLIDTGGSATFNYTVSVTHDNGTDSGWQVTGSIKVSNPNGSDVSGVTVTDAIDNGGNCTVDTSNFSGTVPANSHVDLPYTCTYTSLPPAGTNTATAVAPGGSFTGTASVDFSNATIDITDGSVTVTDTFGGSLGTVSSTNPSPKTFTYSHTFTDPAGTCTTHNNTATFTTSDTSSTGSDSKSVKVCVGADLTVSKTATATLNSSVSKSVDKTVVEQAGGNITFNYTVTVTESGWQVAGGIMVNNPNDWEDITANLSDAITGANCTVNGGTTSVLVNRSSSVTVPYTCTFSSAPSSATGTNTATAMWNGAAAFTPDSSASSVPVGYTFPTLTITDNVQSSANPGGCTATLGTVSVTTTTVNGSPGCAVSGLTSPSYGVFKYSVTDSNSRPGSCTSYNNTAQVTGGSSSNQVTVTVCNTNTGALTMGFWKNTNGQKIISSFCGGTSGTSLVMFLQAFNPFKDDTAATCSKEATYVAGVIGGASCSSSTGTCNTMLRAQMLATALDVYFSDPTLGGNRIGAFNGLGSSQPAIGGVAIDLSHICSMADGSSGSTCTGVSEDARSEFGIASSCLGTTVGQMLLYSDASSAVNGNPVATASTGATWYNQNKGRQVVAKDGFDNINNQIANIAPTSCSPSF